MKVEASLDGGATWCSLPSLPDGRHGHSQSGLLTCGGGSCHCDCLTFTSGARTTTHNLKHKRFHHSVWSSPTGVLIMGGENEVGSSNVTEIIDRDGPSKDGFSLRNTVSNACSIELGDTVIITGGRWNPNAVHAYNIEGFVEILPDLVQGRKKHGCGHYINNDNVMVYLVTGGYWGYYGSGGKPISSTEILEAGAEHWKPVPEGDLPAPMFGLKGVSFDNTIVMTGGKAQNYIYNNVLSYNITTTKWEKIGKNDPYTS